MEAVGSQRNVVEKREKVEARGECNGLVGALVHMEAGKFQDWLLLTSVNRALSEGLIYNI